MLAASSSSATVRCTSSPTSCSPVGVGRARGGPSINRCAKRRASGAAVPSRASAQIVQRAAAQGAVRCFDTSSASPPPSTRGPRVLFASHPSSSWPYRATSQSTPLVCARLSRCRARQNDRLLCASNIVAMRQYWRRSAASCVRGREPPSLSTQRCANTAGAPRRMRLGSRLARAASLRRSGGGPLRVTLGSFSQRCARRSLPLHAPHPRHGRSGVSASAPCALSC